MNIKVEMSAGTGSLDSMKSAQKLARFLSTSGEDVRVSYKFNGTSVLVSSAGLVYALIGLEPDGSFYELWADRDKVETVEVPTELDDLFNGWLKDNRIEKLYSGLAVSAEAAINMLRKAFHFAYWHGWDQASDYCRNSS